MGIANEFKGVWIPAAIWSNRDLSLQEKVFFVEIYALDVRGVGCLASNSHFSKFFGLSKSRCSEVISSLKKKKFIDVEYDRHGEVLERKIFIRNPEKICCCFLEEIE